MVCSCARPQASRPSGTESAYGRAEGTQPSDQRLLCLDAIGHRGRRGVASPVGEAPRLARWPAAARPRPPRGRSRSRRRTRSPRSRRRSDWAPTASSSTSTGAPTARWSSTTTPRRPASACWRRCRWRPSVRRGPTSRRSTRSSTSARGLLVNVEVKNSPGDADFDPAEPRSALVVELVDRRAAATTTVLVSSFHLADVDRVRALDAGDRRPATCRASGPVSPRARDSRTSTGTRAAPPPRRTLGERVAADARCPRRASSGCALNVWTVNDDRRDRATRRGRGRRRSSPTCPTSRVDALGRGDASGDDEREDVRFVARSRAGRPRRGSRRRPATGTVPQLATSVNAVRFSIWPMPRRVRAGADVSWPRARREAATPTSQLAEHVSASGRSRPASGATASGAGRGTCTGSVFDTIAKCRPRHLAVVELGDSTRNGACAWS